MLGCLKLWRLGTIWTAASLVKLGEVLILVETVVDDTVDALQVGWYQVMATKA